MVAGTEPPIDIVDQDDVWKDVTPIPQADTEKPMAQIAYNTKYRKAMDLFRGILKQNELSERALELTAFIIKSSASHYTVWSYRLEILKHLHGNDPKAGHIQKEIKLLDELMPRIQKSYQVWQHRLVIATMIDDPSTEMKFINNLLKTLLCQFNRSEMWNGELPLIEELIEEDVRNNSAWNHRFFLCFDTIRIRSSNLSQSEFESLVQTEVEYTKKQILRAPNNPSAWNYLRGVLKRGSIAYGDLEGFVTPMTKTAYELQESWPMELNKQADLPVPAAVEFLADVLSSKPSQSSRAIDLYELLADKLDPIRKQYWHYRIQSATASC